MILSIDPSIKSAGAAVFTSNGVLNTAVRIQLPVIKGEDQAMRWRRMANAILDAMVYGAGTVDTLVSERPQVYQRQDGKTKGDPNDLLAMVGVIGCLVGMLPSANVVTYAPHEWKGQTEKKVMCGRIMERLKPAERDLVPNSHDAVDAVGVGLFYLNRLGRGRVFPGAT